MTKALFEGLVLDEAGNPLPVAYVGAEPTYVYSEGGFKYHVDARQVDQQVLDALMQQISQNQDLVSQSILKFLDKDDLFTKAAVDTAIRNMDKNLPALFEQGIPEQTRAYLGMLGFRVVINRHGEVLDLDMPAAAIDEDEL
ncbi:MAG: hypothetical protein RMN25_04905 [Anaerolineae bacterium]|nr:hypothetical protein [Thermoflexales bacterium]MDW8407104.1 hypothetical protein [Anaerolineae bacterium]